MQSVTQYEQPFLSQGFKNFCGLFNEDEIDDLRLKAEAALFRTSSEHRERFRSNGSLCNLAELPEYASLIADKRIISAIKSLGGQDVRWTSGYLISKPAGGAPLFWHQDWWGWDAPLSYQAAPPQLFVMIYLTKTAVENGCLRVIPGSHLQQHELHSLPAAHTEDIATNIDLNSPVYASHADEMAVEVNPGDVVIGDARLLHSAYANNSAAERPLLTLWYIPDWSNLPESVQATLQAIYLRQIVDIDDDKEGLLTCEDWPEFAYDKLSKILPDYAGEAEPLPWNRIPDIDQLQSRHSLQSAATN